MVLLFWPTGGSIRQYCYLCDCCCGQHMHCSVAGGYSTNFGYLEKLEQGIVFHYYSVAIYLILLFFFFDMIASDFYSSVSFYVTRQLV